MTRLFTGQAMSPPNPQTPSSVLPDLHRDPSRPPIVAGFDAGISAVIPLGKPEIPAHPTSTATRIRA